LQTNSRKRATAEKRSRSLQRAGAQRRRVTFERTAGSNGSGTRQRIGLISTRQRVVALRVATLRRACARRTTRGGLSGLRILSRLRTGDLRERSTDACQKDSRNHTLRL
jgi:hypothetical protein